MTKYYKKDIPEMPVYVGGVPLKFEVLETADPSLITELDKCVHFQRGGVVGITKEEYDETVKKKAERDSIRIRLQTEAAEARIVSASAQPKSCCGRGVGR